MTRDATLGTSAAWEPNKSLQQQPIRRRHELPATCLERIFGYLSSRSDLVHAALVCRAWTTPALKLIWANFRFVRERDFERVFSIMARQNVSRPYGTYVKALDLVHADREFLVTPNVILLVTALCPNLESISITIHHTRPVAPPVVPPILQNRPVLPPIRRPGDAQPVRPQPPPAAQPPLPHQQHHNNHHANNIRSPPQPQPINNNNHQHPPHPQQHPHPPQQQQQQRQYNHSLPLAHFAHNCRKLKTIRLTSYTPKTDDSVYEMAKYMQSGTLESIMLTGCGTLQSSTLVKLAITNPQLRHIEIMGNTPVSDSSLRALAERCGPHLESISIGNAYNLTDKSITAVAKHCRNLKLLKLFNNADGNRLSEATLLDLLERCIHLRLISLSNARILGESFFAIAAQRVEHQLGVIEKQHGMPTHSGLQSMCLGGVKRQIIDGPSLAHLIDMSASKNDNLDDDDDDDNDDGVNGNGTTITSPTEHTLAPTPTHVPKTTVIRGNTVWWQRRRPVLSKPS